LLGVHFLLAFTISFSLAQILAAAGVLFVFSNLKKSKIFVLSLPAVVTLYYQIFGLQGQVIRYHFMGNPFDLLLSAIPLDRILMAALILVFLIKNSSMRFIDSLKSELGQSLLWGMVSVAMGGILIFLFYVKMNHTEKVGFAIPNRYFVFIFPPVLYALTQGFCQVWQQWQTHPEKWLNRTLVFLLSVLTFLRVLRGFQQYYQGKLF
jgi:hypothetical protein